MSGFVFVHGPNGWFPLKIQAILLAAGQGSRLRPLTEVTPKVALPLLDIPLGAFGLSLLGSYRPLIVNTSHLSDAAVAALVPYGLAEGEVFLEGATALGTAGTLKALENRLADTFITLNADELTDVLPASVLAAHARTGAAATVAVRRVGEGADLVVEGERVTQFIDRRERSTAGAAFIGLAVFSRAVLSLIPKGEVQGIAESLLRPLIERGEVASYMHDGYALDVGTPARYLAASLDLLHGVGPRPPMPFPGRLIEVGVEGTAYVGPGATVGENSLGRGAIVLAGARVEGRVQDSVVWPGATVASGESLSRSIRFSTQTIATTPT
ncbi:MAG: sugar phosphate nucleotidyltransferase [Actinomycetota bacterium]